MEDPDVFFPLVDRVTNPDILVAPQKMTPEAIHQSALQVATMHNLVPEGSLATIEMNLALHAATPKIEAFYHHYADVNRTRGVNCGSWVDWYGQVICDVETLVHIAGVETIDPSNKTSASST